MTKTQLLDLCAQIEAYRVNPHTEHVYTRLREIAKIVPPLLELRDAAQSMADKLSFGGGSDDSYEQLAAALNKIPLSS